MQCFYNVADNLVNLEHLQTKNVSEKARIETELKNVYESTVQFYGFLVKTTKEKKLEDLTKQEAAIHVSVELGNELLSLLYLVMLDVEIPLLKLIKKQRYDKIIFNFSQSRIQEIEKELLVYQSMIEGDQEELENDKNEKIERHDYRFTNLQNNNA